MGETAEGPGETVVMFGEGFGEAPDVSFRREDDGAAGKPGAPFGGSFPSAGRAAVLQASDQCLKVLLPPDRNPGLYRLRVDDATVTINRPTVWWTQIDWGEPGSKSGTLRLFGKNLAGPLAQVYIKGPKALALPVGKHGDTWASSVPLPSALPSGTYQVFYHSGYGGPSGWSAASEVTVARPKVWPATVYNVRDFEADGSGSRDDTASLQAALDKAGAAGGGVVYLPRGRYQCTSTLKLPRFVTLRGVSATETAIFWPDMPTPPEALVQGTNCFALENVTLYATQARHVIVGDTGEKPDAGNVRLFRVRTRINAYRGHIPPEEVDKRFRDTLRISGGDTVRVGGENIRITQCDLYGNGRALYFSRVRGGVVRGNQFYNGRHGWYCISGSDGLIFEDNSITGGDLMSTGGGLNCLDGSSYSQNVYYARNKLSLMHGWDREAMTSDAGGGLYYGPIAKADGVTLTLPEAPKSGRNWEGAAVFVFSGKGWTQMRRVVKVEGDKVTVERPWDVAPDATSLVGITMLQRHYILDGNSFSDAGIAIQFYGSSYEHIVSGNTCARAGGYQGIGKPYGGYQLPPDKNPCHQPSWFCQFVDNKITEGNIYRSGANNSILSGDSVIGVFGWPLTKDWPWPYNVGAVVKRNELSSNARIQVGGSGNEKPSVSDALVEFNTIRDSQEGVRLDRAVSGIMLRGNRFTKVAMPLGGQGLDNARLPSGQLPQAELARLQAVAAECGVKEDVAQWPEAQGAIEALADATVWTDAEKQASARATAALLAGLGKRNIAVAPETLARVTGLSVEVDRGSSLPAMLGPGKADTIKLGTLKLNVSLAQPLPNCEIAAELLPPWPATGGEPVAVKDGKAQLTLTAQVPPKAWGRVRVPLKLTMIMPQSRSTLARTVTVGSGRLREWMVLGPLPNKSGEPLDLTLYPPEDALDLKAEVEGAKWQPIVLGGDWLDLAKLYGKTPGVAYAVACIQAEKEAPAMLELGSSGGLSVSLNGAYVWSLNQSRNAAGAQDRVPLTLRAGDNVLLVKLSTNSKDWKFTGELVSAEENFPGAVGIVPAAQFAGRPCFSPPAARPAAEAGEVRFPAGVNWKLIYADDFTGDTLSARWRQAAGKWVSGNGFLRSSGDRCFLGYAEKLSAPVRIEYDTRAAGATAGDFSAFWLSDPANHSSGYLMGFGSNSNACNKILVNGTEVLTATRPLVTPGKWHHVIAQILADGRVQLIVDGQLSLDYKGPAPGGAKHPGLWTWGPEGIFSKVRIYGE